MVPSAYRLAATTLAFVALLVGCADDATDIASPGSSVEQCDLVLVEDEYGNEIELCSSDASDPAVLSSNAPNASEEKAQQSTRTATIDRNHLAEVTRFFLAPACDHTAVQPEIRVEGDEQLRRDLASATDALATARANCDTQNYPNDWAAAVLLLERAVGIQSVDTRTPEALSSRTLTALAYMQVEFAGRSLQGAHRSVFHADEMVARLELERRFAAGTPPATVLIGSSIAVRAVNGAQLDARVEGGFLNVAVGGADPEEWLGLLDRLFEGLPFPETVVVAESPHRLLQPNGFDCTTLADTTVANSDRFRDRIFPDLDAAVWRKILGPAGQPSPVAQGPLSRFITDRYLEPGLAADPWGPGTLFVDETEDDRYPNGAFCEESIAIAGDLTTLVAARGAEPVYLFVPIHPADPRTRR